MSQDELNRRNFNRLTAAALGGMVAGASWGCGSKSDPNAGVAPPSGPGAPTGGDAVEGGSVAAGEKHVCRGLNDCKGQGAGGENACRGQGQCATYERHDCAGENACKGQGGCGETVGLNDCKGQGGCALPLMEEAWKAVRARKEGAWNAANQQFAEAPPAPDA
jgi:hypothetical protein